MRKFYFILLAAGSLALVSCGESNFDIAYQAAPGNTENKWLDYEETRVKAPGHTLTLTGVGFSADDYLLVGDVRIEPAATSASSISFVLPETIAAGLHETRLVSLGNKFANLQAEREGATQFVPFKIKIVAPIEVPQIRGLESLGGRPGSELTLLGYNLNDKIEIYVGATLVDWTLVSTSELVFELPASTSTSTQLLVKYSGEDLFQQRLLITEQDLPFLTLEPEEVCSDLRYYDGLGQIFSGSKQCVADLEPTIVSDCEADGEIGCKTTTRFKAADTQSYGAANIATGLTVAGIEGSATIESHVDCNAVNRSGCVATAIYQTMDLSAAGSAASLDSAGFDATIANAGNFEFWDAAGVRHAVAGDPQLDISNIRAGIEIHGKTGQYPSTTYRLPSASATNDLVSGASFNSFMASNSSFEFWASDGTYHSSSGDVDIATASNIKSGVEIFGTPGSLAASADCSSDGEVGCTTTASLPAASPPNTFDLRAGTTVAGVSGKLKPNCRSLVRTATYNYDGDLPSINNGSEIGGTDLNWWDTTHDQVVANIASENPWSSDDYKCGGTAVGLGSANANFVSVTTDSDTYLYDRFSELAITSTGSSSDSWSVALNNCNSLSFGGASGWRLISLQEVYTLLANGFSEVAKASGGLIQSSDYWSATGWGSDTDRGYQFWVHMGEVRKDFGPGHKSASGGYSLCVRSE